MNEIVQICEFPPVTEERLGDHFTCRRLWQADDQDSFLDGLNGVRGLATSGFDGVDANVLSRLPDLEIISCFAVGVDAVDLDYAKANDIIVTNTPDVLTDCVADLGLALILASARKVVEADRFMRRETWNGEIYPLSTSLKGKTLGIVGFGRIGQAVAERAQAFGIRIAYQGPNRKPAFDHPYFEDAADLAEISDFLIVCCPGGPATANLIDGRVLEGLGPMGHLVNIARGSVVDEDALLAALQSGGIAGAALDVYAREPEFPAVFRELENIILQPHHGSGTFETRKAMGDLMIDNLIAHFEGKEVLTRVI